MPSYNLDSWDIWHSIVSFNLIFYFRFARTRYGCRAIRNDVFIFCLGGPETHTLSVLCAELLCR